MRSDKLDREIMIKKIRAPPDIYSPLASKFLAD